MEYTDPSTANPGLVVIVVDMSGSMAGSGVINDIQNSIPELQKLGKKKRRMIKFHCVSFGVSVHETSSWLEDARGSFLSQDIDKRTNLKLACSRVREIYDEHVKNCSAENPLTNILFFTDGNHSPTLDVDQLPGIIAGVRPNKWNEKNANQWLGLENHKNVLIGVIDYDSVAPMESLPEPTIYHPKRSLRFTDASVLEESLVMQAYEREEEEEIPLQDSLKGIFGPAENLIGKQFIIGADLIKKHPKITTAFIKLGTFSMRSGKGDSGTRPKGSPPPEWTEFL